MSRLLAFFIASIALALAACGRTAPTHIGAYEVEVESAEASMDRQEDAAEVREFFEGLKIELKAAGKATLTHQGDKRETTWSADGSTIVIQPPTPEGLALTVVSSRDGKTLTPRWSDEQGEQMAGLKVRFVKQ